MKKLFSGLGITLLLMISMTGCADPESSALLTDGAWDFSNITTDSEDELVKITVGVLNLGHTGATIEFQTGGDYIKEYAVGDPETGTWLMIGDDRLTITPDGEDSIPIPAKINELSKDKLSYDMTIPDEELNTHTATITWTRN